MAVLGDGSVVAHALCTRCHVDGAASLALAPVSVLPAYQNSGLGDADLPTGTVRYAEPFRV